MAQAKLIAAVVGPEEERKRTEGFGRRGIDLINGSPEPVYRIVAAMVALPG